MQRDRDPLIEQLEALRRRLENVRLEEEHLVAEIAIAEVRARRGRGEQPHPPPAFHIDVDPPVFALPVFALMVTDVGDVGEIFIVILLLVAFGGEGQSA